MAGLQLYLSIAVINVFCTTLTVLFVTHSLQPAIMPSRRTEMYYTALYCTALHVTSLYHPLHGNVLQMFKSYYPVV